MLHITHAAYQRLPCSAGGGAIYSYYGNSDTVIARCLFIENSAPDGYGGALGFYYGGSDPLVTNSSFIRNSAGLDGGAVWFYLQHKNVVISNSLFLENRGKLGVVCFSLQNTFATLSNVTFERNNAFDGALYLYNANLNVDIVDCKFIGNVANNSGGGIYMYYANNDIDVTNCEFRDNVALIDHAGAVMLETNNMRVRPSAVLPYQHILSCPILSCPILILIVTLHFSLCPIM
jgi:parallel beta-helix repeat protein